MDREQRELSSGGNLKRVVPPVPTADELAALEAKRKADAERLSRQSEERRKERALVSRYPNEAAHQRERAKALEQVEAVDAAIVKRIQDLAKQRQGIDDEMGFYAKDPGKAPAWLKHKLQDNDKQAAAQVDAQKRQQLERQRMNERFDAELAQLKRLWAETAAVGTR
jgi:Mn-containing catalase